MDNNHKIAFCGLMTAISAVLAILLNVFTFNTLFIMIVLSLIIAIITQKYGPAWSATSFVATTLIMFFVTWRYDAVTEYFFIFGSFPIVKFLIERKQMKIIRERLIKLGYTVVLSIIFTFVVINFIGGVEYFGELYTATDFMPYIIVAATVIFWNAYDYILTFVIHFYNVKFGK